MTPPPSTSKKSVGTDQGTISKYVSDLLTSILNASERSRITAEMTIEASKAERAKSQNKNFKPFPRLDQVLDLGIISDREIELIMPARALENLDKSLKGYLEVSLTSLEATKMAFISYRADVHFASNRIKVSPGPKSAKNSPNPPGPHLS